MPDWSTIEQSIEDTLGLPFSATQQQAIGGGCINDAYKLSDGVMHYFVKLNKPQYAEMLAAERDGLDELANSQTIRVPRPVAHGASDSYSFLITEYLSLGGRMDNARFAADLAAMHQTTSGKFGWLRNNTIGLTPQNNRQCDLWVEFFAEYRLGEQLRLAEANGAPTAMLDHGWKLAESLNALFSQYQAIASLLHGDLWGGNYSSMSDGTPVIFDPAVYYGDHETDLAMMELFGHPGEDFFSAYRDRFPIDADYPVRRTLYNAYHIINHFNLFGGGYAAQADHMLCRTLSEIQ